MNPSNYDQVSSYPSPLVLWHRLVILISLASSAWAASSADSAPGFEEVIAQRQPGQMYEKLGVGHVRFKPAVGSETNAAVPQPLGFDEALRTLELSGAAVRLSDQSYLRLKELTRLEIVRQPLHTNAPMLKVHSGQV